jgi:hypothetical protein
VRRDGKEGFIDRHGVIVIEPTYDKVYPFSDALAAVQARGLWGYIDVNGHLVISPQFAFAGGFSEGLASFRHSPSSPFGYIDRQGQVVIEPQFDIAARFEAGIAQVGFQTCGSIFKVFVMDVGVQYQHMYIDRTGRFVTKPEVSRFANSNRDAILLVEAGGLYGYCDPTGAYIVAPRFRSARAFADGLACVHDGKAWGFIDRTGEFVIAPRFEYAHSFSQGLAAVRRKGSNWEFIDTSTAVVIAPRFDWVLEGFRHGLAHVVIDGKEGYIDPTGHWVWEPSK